MFFGDNFLTYGYYLINVFPKVCLNTRMPHENHLVKILANNPEND